MTRGPALRRPAGLVACVCLLACVSLLVLALPGCGGSGGGDKVTLQLNWYHEAEFVGYYVAEDKGFFDNQGLDVTILEGGPGTPARDKVLNGEANFAITSFAEQRDMVTQGKPVTAVMAAFQIPPLVIFSLTESSIFNPSDLVGKRVGTTTTYWKKILEQTLSAAGVDPSKVTEVDVKPDQMQLLYEHSVDAWLGYAQDEPIRAQVAGHNVRSIYPADFGVGGYEGLLITQADTVAKNPDLIKRFVRACYDGWRYALEHADEAAQLLTKWAPDNGLEFQKLAVRAVIPLVDVPQMPIGWIDTGRWQQLMGDSFDPQHPGYTTQFSPLSP